MEGMGNGRKDGKGNGGETEMTQNQGGKAAGRLQPITPNVEAETDPTFDGGTADGVMPLAPCVSKPLGEPGRFLSSTSRNHADALVMPTL